jgi:hypothetical protein
MRITVRLARVELRVFIATEGAHYEVFRTQQLFNLRIKNVSVDV